MANYNAKEVESKIKGFWEKEEIFRFDPKKKSKIFSVDRIVTVGPERMMKAVSDLAVKHDIPCQVSVERYIKCGFGVCGQCCIDDSGMATCMEGPVMDHLRARAQVEFGAYHRDKVGRKKIW